MDVYRVDEDYDAGSQDVNNPSGTVSYIRNIIEKYRSNTVANNAIEIESISTDDADTIGVVETDGNHGLVDDDIIRLELKSDIYAKTLKEMVELPTGYYRVVRIDTVSYTHLTLPTILLV